MSTAAALLAAPLLRRQSMAAAAVLPKRFVVFQSWLGTYFPEWRPVGGETDFQFGRILAPLESLKPHLNIIDGLDNLGPAGDAFDDHAKAFITQLTATDLVKGPDGASLPYANGISIDQLIASRIGGATRVPSLYMVGNNMEQVSTLCYSAPGIQVRPYLYAADVFADVFHDLTGDPAELERLLAQRRSVLDAIRGELTAVEQLLGTEAKHTLQAHAQAIREVEKRLDPRSGTGAACVPPDEAELVRAKNVILSGVWSFPDAVKLNLDVLALALTCDITRVATFGLMAGGSGYRFEHLGQPHSHHDNSHCLMTGPGVFEDQKEEYVQAEAWIAGQYAYLLEKLRAVPEGFGTMLDNSLAMWIHENGDPHSHSQYSIPIVLAGSAGGSVRTGRYLKYTQGNPLQANGRNINDLYVSIAHAFGQRDVTSFGTPGLNEAPLEGLVA